mmetsp:Transcript_105923/g.146532  ORF Transcript_105923/g.146532 Transcript_105923/m.146532 type:complete len:203 (+) Transcript_105923:267-875(+)
MLNGSPENANSPHQLELGHLANTYTALCLLIVCGDYKLAKVNKNGLLEQLAKFQSTKSGCFRMLTVESDEDVRACYCAAAISYILKVVNKEETYGFDVQAMHRFLLDKCIGYQGGFTFEGNHESHSGLTYCATGALLMTGHKFDERATNRLLEFCMNRKIDGGFQGRCNKLADVCYSFWNKGTMDMLILEDPDTSLDELVDQ